MPLVSRRAITALGLAAGVVIASTSIANATAGPIGAAAAKNEPTKNVIVILRNQHTDLTMSKSALSPRVSANRRDTADAMAAARGRGAHNVRGFDLIDGYSATVTAAQAAAIRTNSSVAGVYPDLPIPAAPRLASEAPTAGPPVGPPPPAAICPSSPGRPLLEPEALGVTNTAFVDPSKPQAQTIVDGDGIKVGYIADGVDINNPDFIRADGSHVFADYQDFSGEGKAAPSDAAEAFGDASAIAAQGRRIYDLSQFVNPVHPLPAGCTITVRGVAPGASLVGLKVFGNAPTAPTSRFIQAIQYAVDTAGVDVLNESFGSNPYPDSGTDPITLTDLAAVAAGVTVVSSTGDAGTNGTIGSPSSTRGIIAVGATTTFQSYLQTGFAGVQLSNGRWVDDNISSLSSGGITQSAKVPDLVAPGDLGWALCSPDPAIYQGCVDNSGEPSSLLNFGGTSQSSPLTSGAAALVIEAYEHAHHGVRPSPALVARLLTGSATDLGHPAYEQGAGLLNTLAAVQAAESFHDANGAPTAHGNALIPAQPQYSTVGHPGRNGTTLVRITNVGTATQSVHASTRMLGRVVADRTGTVTLNTSTAPTFIDETGTPRSYVRQAFHVGHADRLDLSIASNSQVSPARIILIDPHGVYTAYSLPQGVANFGHVDVRFPEQGTWTAYFALSASSGFNGPIHWRMTTSDYRTHGRVYPSSFRLAPGKSTTLRVSTNLGRQPGDLSESVQLRSSVGATTSIPLTLRTVVPPHNTTFRGTITGGNGRAAGGPAQTNVFYLDIPKGKKDLSLGVRFVDPGQIVLAYLIAPDGQVYSDQSNLNFNLKLVYNGIQMYRRNPQAGRWTFELEVTNPVSGSEVAQPFLATVRYDSVKVKAALPNSATRRLAAGVPVTVPVTIKNTGSIPLSYFADGRLDTVGAIRLADLGGDPTFALPVPAAVEPIWLVPTEVSQFTAVATADQPVTLEVFYGSGQPDLASNPGTAAAVQFNAEQVSPGEWAADIGQIGPYGNAGAPAGTVSVAATAVGRLFDPAISASTPDFWQVGVDPTGQPATAKVLRERGLGPTAAGSSRTTASPANAKLAVSGPPNDLPPGASTTITLTIRPSGMPGTMVQGHLYIDTVNMATGSGDELVSLPYEYTIG